MVKIVACIVLAMLGCGGEPLAPLPETGRMGGDPCTSSKQCQYRCCSPVDWSQPDVRACLDPFENGTDVRVCSVQ